MRVPPPKSRQPRPSRPQAGSAPGRQPAAAVMPNRAPSRAPDTRDALPNPSVARNLLLYGLHPVAAAWTNPARRCLHLYATPAGLAARGPALERAAAAGLKRPQPQPIDRIVLDRMLPADAVHQGLALAAEPLPETNLDDVLIAAGAGPLTLVMLDQVTDPHNIGAILRSAAAFGAKGVIVHRRHAPDLTGVMAKAASGAAEIVPILRETNLARALDALKDAGLFVIGLDERGPATIAEIEIGTRAVLTLGAEGPGLRRLVAEGCTALARLPTEPPIASLNVSNAAAVGLYEIARRRL